MSPLGTFLKKDLRLRAETLSLEDSEYEQRKGRPVYEAPTACPSAHLEPGNEAALLAPRSERRHQGSGGLGLWFKGTPLQEAEPRLEPTARERDHSPGSQEAGRTQQCLADNYGSVRVVPAPSSLEAIQSRGKPTSYRDFSLRKVGGSVSKKKSACNAGDPGSTPGREWQPTPVFLPGES